MNDYDGDLCVAAFSKFCDNAERNELVNSADCQYWVFEQGYLAAMKEIAKIVQPRHDAGAIDLSQQLIPKHVTYQ